MPDKPKKILTFISRRAPYGTENAQVCMEAALASAVFEQHVNYLFVDDGIYQLLKSQQPSGISSKNLSGSLTALELYGIEQVHVDARSLEARNLNPDDLVIGVNLLDPEQLSNLICESDVVFNL